MAVNVAYMMPSTTPSNSRRRNRNTPSTPSPFQNSSTSGALSTAPAKLANLGPPTAAAALATTVLISAENPTAASAPQSRQPHSAYHGSGSKRSSSRGTVR